MITNQSGIGRGLLTTQQVIDQHTWLCQKLASHNIEITGYRICPHHPDEGCKCRKPKPYMIIDAAEEFKIDLTESWMIGDKRSDVEAGFFAGCLTGYIETFDNPYQESWTIPPTLIGKDLYTVVNYIINEER